MSCKKTRAGICRGPVQWHLVLYLAQQTDQTDQQSTLSRLQSPEAAHHLMRLSLMALPLGCLWCFFVFWGVFSFFFPLLLHRSNSSFLSLQSWPNFPLSQCSRVKLSPLVWSASVAVGQKITHVAGQSHRDTGKGPSAGLMSPSFSSRTLIDCHHLPSWSRAMGWVRGHLGEGPLNL